MSNDQKPTKPVEATKHTLPPGAPPTAGQQYETPEPKRREPQTPEEAKRAPQHEPGYEAKQQAEEAKHKPKDKDDEHEAPKPRSHAAKAKQHVRRMAPRKPVRKHK